MITKDNDGKVLGIAYNVIPVADLEKSANWFVEHLDFNIRHKTEESLSLFIGNRPILYLIKSEHQSRAVFEVGGRKKWITTFFTNDIKSLHEKLKSKQLIVGDISYESENGNFFTLEDIDGNLYDIWENHDCELNF
ncbi:VOC family protein [Heyndrickxia sp. NPDC080065]|uniref:VOC family protein n=1 Tax=Heyndrickxia sp. NPDC080065 TaxID=3390568 RepID=UPI003D0181E5